MRSCLFILVSLIPSILAIDPVEIIGNKWFNSKTGEEFIIKGVAYQPGGSGKQDPIVNIPQLTNAIKLFKELDINTIRVYETYPNLDHDKGMKMLADAGIYVIFDLSNPKTSINRNTPKYDTTIFEAFLAKADAFAKYENTLAYFAGNEVNNEVNNTNSNPFVKATIRDIKAHVKTQKRYIPVGYSNNDDKNTLQNIVDYLNCGPKEQRIDFFGYNIYSWCKSDDTMQTSSYDKKTEMFKNYGIPVFFSEYGCNTSPPRQFGDIPHLYSEPMNKVFTGGLVFEFTNEKNSFGLTKVDGDDFTKLGDFDAYKKQLNKLDLKPTSKNSYTPPSGDGTTCPTLGSNWQASNNLPPIPSVEACKCLMSTYSCVISSSFNVTSPDNDVGPIFEYACSKGNVDCTRLSADGAKGEYGDLSFCDPTTQLSYAFNSMYQKSKDKNACINEGKGEIKTPSNNKEEACLLKTANIERPTGNNNGQFLLPSFASLAISTIVSFLFI